MATAVKLDPNTGLPVTRIVSPSILKPLSLSNPIIPDSSWGMAPGEAGTRGPFAPPPPGTGYRGPDAGITYGSATTIGGSDTSSSSSSSSSGGSNIDYQSLIQNDPGLQQLRAELAAGNISAAQFRKAAIQRAVIAFGRAPDEAGMDPATKGFYTEDVDPLTRQLAEKNTAEGLSTTAHIDRAHQVALQGLQNVLAQRGMLQSGALGVGLGLEGQQNKEEGAKATGELLDYLSGQARAYAEHLHQSKLQEAQAVMETTQAYMQAYAGGNGAGGGGGGGGGGINWTSGAQESLARAGFTPDAVAAAIRAAASARGWGPYWENGVGTNYGLQQNGQYVTNSDGSISVWVKVHTPAGNSTELINIGKPPSTQPTPSPTPTPTPTPTPVPVTTPPPVIRPPGPVRVPV